MQVALRIQCLKM